MFLPVRSPASVAIGVIVGIGVTFNAFLGSVRNAEIDCAKGSTKPISCVADVAGAILFGLATIVEVGIATTTLIGGTLLAARDDEDHENLPEGYHLLHVDGKHVNASTFFTREWLADNLKEGKRIQAISNSSVGVGRSQLLTELWLEGGQRKLTTSLYHPTGALQGRAATIYVHWSADAIIWPGHVHTTAPVWALQVAANDVVNWMANSDVGDACLQLSNDGSTALYDESVIWAGLDINESKLNFATKSTTCESMFRNGVENRPLIEIKGI